MKLPLTLLALAGLALSASAQTVTHSDDTGLTPIPFDLTLNLPQFDPSLGVLWRVELVVTAEANGTVGVENVQDFTELVRYGLNASTAVTGAPDIVMALLAIDTTADLGPYDGTTDFGGTSGETSIGTSSNTDMFLTVLGGGDLSPWIGTGQVAFPTRSAGACFVEPMTGVSDLPELLCELQGRGRVEVTYHFGDDCNDNGIPDFMDLCAGDVAGDEECSDDCNDNGIPDECEPDCNGNGIPDSCDSEPCESDELDCEEFDRFEDLTPNDTLSVATRYHNPQQEQGYLYAYAVDPSNQGIGFDHLIGQLLVVDGMETLQYSVNPVDYRAGVAEGEGTDLDSDGVRDLNGEEYEMTAAEILVPRFLGVSQAGTRGQLILIALSGGTQFATTADLLIYNDDEDVFSAQHTFFCWDKSYLDQVSFAFLDGWLQDFSGQNPEKSLGGVEYGWFRVDGGVANSPALSILDPAVYAVYVEKLLGTCAADLPFELCTQPGHLLPRSVSGDNEESSSPTGTEPGGGDECVTRTGRRPASLLLYPEFDNRSGVASVVTVTNTSATDDVRVHFIYIGRFGGVVPPR